MIVTGTVGVLFLVVVRKIVEARLAPPFPSGTDALLGARVRALTPLAPRGQVESGGERWLAIADDGPHEQGDELIVRSVEGLTLHVELETAGAPAPTYAPPRPQGAPTPARGVR